MKIDVSLLSSLLLSSLVACTANEASDPTESGVAAATATTRAKLDDFTGRWDVATRTFENYPMPEKIRIDISDETVDPATGSTKGTKLRLLEADSPIPAVDRAPFLNVDEGQSCENISEGGGSSLTICHETTLRGGVLSHTVSARSWTGYVFPSGWSKATQTLELSSAGQLHYKYVVDGQLSQDVTMKRP